MRGVGVIANRAVMQDDEVGDLVQVAGSGESFDEFGEAGIRFADEESVKREPAEAFAEEGLLSPGDDGAAEADESGRRSVFYELGENEAGDKLLEVGDGDGDEAGLERQEVGQGVVLEEADDGVLGFLVDGAEDFAGGEEFVRGVGVFSEPEVAEGGGEEIAGVVEYLLGEEQRIELVEANGIAEDGESFGEVPYGAVRFAKDAADGVCAVWWEVAARQGFLGCLSCLAKLGLSEEIEEGFEVEVFLNYVFDAALVKGGGEVWEGGIREGGVCRGRKDEDDFHVFS